MVGVPALVLRRLDELGDRGRRWLDRGGQAAIVKVAIPSGGEGYSEFERELLVLTLAKHPSYVDVATFGRGWYGSFGAPLWRIGKN